MILRLLFDFSKDYDIMALPPSIVDSVYLHTYS